MAQTKRTWIDDHYDEWLKRYQPKPDLNELPVWPFDDETKSEESDEVRALREEYGNKLLAEQAKVEELKEALKIAKEDADAMVAGVKDIAEQRDAFHAQLRKVNNTLQRCYKASTVLHEALYGVGS